MVSTDPLRDFCALVCKVTLLGAYFYGATLDWIVFYVCCSHQQLRVLRSHICSTDSLRHYCQRICRLKQRKLDRHQYITII